MLPKYETLVEEIKTRRKELGWSQKTLARRANVSKSLVGKLERMDNIPNYRNVRAIYKAIKQHNNERTAETFATKKITNITPETTIKEAAEMMKDNDFSQLPVKEENDYVGLILSSDIANLDDRSKEVHTLKYHSLPVIPHDTPRDDFTSMFNIHKAVLVKKNKDVIGMITPADLL